MRDVWQKCAGTEIAWCRELNQKGQCCRVAFKELKKPRWVEEIAYPRLMIAIHH